MKLVAPASPVRQTAAVTLILRQAVESDLGFLWTWLHGTPNAEWKLWDGPYFDEPASPSRAEFERMQRAHLSNPNRRIIDVDGQPVGVVTRFEEEPTGGGWWELGIVIYDSCQWGKGIGREALSQWLKLIFDETDAHVVTLQTWSGNERMIASARHCGFAECGRIPEARSWKGRRWDSVRMCAVRSEDS